MDFYIASDDPSERRSESFWNIFRSEQKVGVLLPGMSRPIRIPTEREVDAYWYRGPEYFDSPERFEEVRAYMKHYYLHAPGSPEKYWEAYRLHNERLAEFIRQKEAAGEL